jgi:hypothetical protein
MVNMLLRDLVIANVAAIIFALILFMVGWSPINAISISFLISCALLLIWGGALGFFLSSASFDSLMKYFRRSHEREEESEVDNRRPKLKTKKEERKEQVNVGKRLIITGFILLGELLLLSLLYILI